MSEVETTEVPETGPVSVDDILVAIQQKNIGQAKSFFQDVMADKVHNALEAEKVNMASQIFNGVEIPEPGVVDGEEQEEVLASAEEEPEVEETEEETEVEETEEEPEEEEVDD